MADITLYDLPGCPFCAKVRTKLEELDLEYDVIEVPRSHADRTDVEDVSGQTGVPVITDETQGVEGLYESDDIVEYLEETYA
ncbi:glutathione S-transferase N-terminal domain-containing protein [Natronobacterium gregoryi]|uniref:Glutaredoxin n=2 Tax=Natronobacterium gregoryi TaxID=44930 RepID=L0AIC6_NATGS|nr:glutathione S-transferase N-terminal domain-containing protein [Natronobacterium gregoryi]AFZ73623.1 glutathione S-transferase [Natronobacterium gregoryi SP2]ELY67906.1 glutaredoxin [Natronobacterium gregoryi SP2]PLK19987.1 glutaredoxin [Natronobacterium gregoryi SP2]SFJ34094.1 Glutathione S-transferase, N-terminal domain [Natronobacterium gregoryi]